MRGAQAIGTIPPDAGPGQMPLRGRESAVVSRANPVDTARALVAEYYPKAQQAWLSGSVVLGGATSTSDLDIAVLLNETVAHRTSLVYRDWPAEVFVHNRASLRWFVAQDVGRRRPTMARMVAHGVALLPGGEGEALQAECSSVLAAGPARPAGTELTMARYTLTDLLDDLVGGADPELLDAIAVDTWRSAAELHLAANRAWSGTGKWLIRELRQLDETTEDDVTGRLRAGLHAALSGEAEQLVVAADEILDQVGGRLWAGLSLAAPPAASVAP